MNMRKYYLFIIDKNFKSIYLKNTDILYQTIRNLYTIKNEDLRFGISIYNQIFKTFNKKLLIKYLREKYNLKSDKDKYYLVNGKEEILIKFNYSCVIIYSNINIPSIFKILYLYNKNIFVVDFKNEDYFWLVKETLK